MTSVRLELLERVLDTMAAGALAPVNGRAIARHYTAAVTGTEAAARVGTTASACVGARAPWPA